MFESMMDQVLTNKQIERTLKAHHIETFIMDGKVFGVQEWTIERDGLTAEGRSVDDLTGYTVRQIRDWLFY